jgi:preprotein translocase subunit SecA
VKPADVWAQNKKLEVQATQLDRDLSINKDCVQIIGDKAIWKNTWTAAGTDVVWDMVHYDVQLIGGIVLHQGKISEMGTGEGKTLVATLPVYLNALSGRGVHLVTVNDYLAKRDSEWMAPLFEFHGLRIDCIDKHQPNSEGRRAAYLADITYGTNNEFGFDYLRDNMASQVRDLVQRKHNFAIVDEVDSVLIDDARTPLIISGPTPKGDVHEFAEFKPKVEKLVKAQRDYANIALTDAKRLLALKPGEGDKKDYEQKMKDGGLALLRAHRALPKNKALIKFLSEEGIRATLQKTENFYMQDNNKEMPKVDEELYFVIDEKSNSIDLTEKGLDLITSNTDDAHFFVVPDVGARIADIERLTTLSSAEKLKQKDDLMRDYSQKVERIHTIQQLLKAYTLFDRDIEYVVMDNKVKIVDEQTGRIMEGRRYSDGLHQAIESKENVRVEASTQTYATVTLQNYFRMYHKLAGMTGTASTEATEFWQIYKLDVVEIPTNRPIARADREDLVYKTAREKYNAIIQEIETLTQQNRPVLVGTTSVETSELLSKFLKMRNIKHSVLNAKTTPKRGGNCG